MGREMKQINEVTLETDITYRYRYLAEFIDFSDQDAAAIHAAAGHLAPLIPQIVERTYERLLSFDASARHFVQRQHGYDGPLSETLESLATDDPQMQFRKEHLIRYLMHLVGRAYDDKMAAYLDMVGKMHTPQAGNKEIDVPLVQMNALLGLLSDIVTDTIHGLDLDRDTERRMLRAWNKLFWIQNDFIGRQYQREVDT